MIKRAASRHRNQLEPRRHPPAGLNRDHRRDDRGTGAVELSRDADDGDASPAVAFDAAARHAHLEPGGQGREITKLSPQ